MCERKFLGASSLTENYGTKIYMEGKIQGKLPVVTKKVTFKLRWVKSKSLDPRPTGIKLKQM
jgi:hypothetical protein